MLACTSFACKPADNDPQPPEEVDQPPPPPQDDPQTEQDPPPTEDPADADPPPPTGPNNPIPLAEIVAKPGCEPGGSLDGYRQLLNTAPDFKNPPNWDFASSSRRAPFEAKLDVEYKDAVLAGCATHLRQFAGPKYDGRPVAPTMVIRPGQNYRARIDNNLPVDPDTELDIRMRGKDELHELFGGHGGHSTILGYVPPEETSVNHNEPGDFNVTNLHTHGWHVDPTGHSDNIFAAIGPGDPPYRQLVELPANHVAGTFWYHAHLHGSTTIQVASGMAGALIVVDTIRGLGAIPQVRDARDRIFVLQQLAYDGQGEIEDYDHLQQRGYASLNRPIFVSGQVYPKVEANPGEVQRWRFVHAGITDGINPGLIDAAGTRIPIQEIALDGLPTGKMTTIQNATLSPGYRVDVLAKLPDATPGSVYYIVDTNQCPYRGPANTPVGLSNCVEGKIDKNFINLRYVLAQVTIVAGQAPVREFPSPAQLAKAKQDYIYGKVDLGAKDPYKGVGPLNDISQAELATGKQQTVHFYATSKYRCPDQGGSCSPCLDADKNLVNCKPGDPTYRVYMTCEGKDSNNFWSCINFNSSADYARTLALDTASRWEVSGAIEGQASQNNHTFHIHVNPFQVQRKFVDGSSGPLGDEWVWKDTLKAPVVQNEPFVDPAVLKSRYTEFTGAFVQHCHVLNHEDQGMMQVVEVRPAAADLRERMRRLTEDLRKMLLH